MVVTPDQFQPLSTWPMIPSCLPKGSVPAIIEDKALRAVIGIQTVRVDIGGDTRHCRGRVAGVVVNERPRPCVCRLKRESMRKLLSHRHLKAVELVLRQYS